MGKQQDILFHMNQLLETAKTSIIKDYVRYTRIIPDRVGQQILARYLYQLFEDGHLRKFK